MSLDVRDAAHADLPAIAGIYAHHVRTGLASFETEPPDLAEMTARFEAVRAKGFPWLACEIDGRLAGYAYASPYRARPGYRFTLEDSVYVHPDLAGRDRIGHFGYFAPESRGNLWRDTLAWLRERAPR